MVTRHQAQQNESRKPGNTNWPTQALPLFYDLNLLIVQACYQGKMAFFTTKNGNL